MPQVTGLKRGEVPYYRFERSYELLEPDVQSYGEKHEQNEVLHWCNHAHITSPYFL